MTSLTLLNPKLGCAQVLITTVYVKLKPFDLNLFRVSRRRIYLCILAVDPDKFSICCTNDMRHYLKGLHGRANGSNQPAPQPLMDDWQAASLITCHAWPVSL